MGYQNKQILTFDLKTADMAGAVADNTDLFHIVIPAAREVEILGMNAYVRLASDTATDSIELCLEDSTVKCQVVIGATGAVGAKSVSDQAVAATFPIRIAPQSTTALKTLKLRSNGATDVTTDVTVQIELSGL